RFEFFYAETVARLAVEGNTHVLDCGTKEGIPGIIGAKVAAKPRGSAVLIGVAPIDEINDPDQQRNSNETKDDEKSRKPLDPNHTHFVLTEGEAWSDAGNT